MTPGLRTRRSLACWAGPLLAIACASPTPPPVTLRIENWSERAIESIHIKPCEGEESELRVLPDSRLAAGASVMIDVPRRCSDLVAFDPRDDVVAEQRGLRVLPGTLWAID